MFSACFRCRLAATRIIWDECLSYSKFYIKLVVTLDLEIEDECSGLILLEEVF